MKRLGKMLFSLAAVMVIPTGLLTLHEVNASAAPSSLGETREINQSKVNFAYEMAQITTRVLSSSATNVETFKVDFSYAIAQVTAKVMPLIPSAQQAEFAYEMAQITSKVLNDKNLDIEKAKAEFSYEAAQLTSRIIKGSEKALFGFNTVMPSANITDKSSSGDKKSGSTDSTFDGLVDELMKVGSPKSTIDRKVNIGGDIRYHFALNGGTDRWNRDSSGFRLRLGLNTEVSRDWRVFALIEDEESVINYNKELTLSNLYVNGKSGITSLTAGAFGYLMAEGNIYDSTFRGVKAEIGEPVTFALSQGTTDSTKDTTVISARYKDYDYDVEGGLYHYRFDGTEYNTIWTLGSNYYFSNFSLGAMYLSSSRTDTNGKNDGYVLGIQYGDLKTYRPGTYDAFAKYYRQPQYTYISHGMNGLGGRMQGFKGYGIGTHYTLAKDVVGGLEYFNLTDMTLGDKGNTWWAQFTYYF